MKRTNNKKKDVLCTVEYFSLLGKHNGYIIRIEL